MLNSFLTDAMLVAGLGMLLDTIFISNKEKKRISEYLDKASSNQSLSERFSDFLEIAHSIVFGRFFSTSLFSRWFLLSAAAVSLTSLCTVLALQGYFFPEQFTNLKLDRLQIGLFVAFIAFNIVFDYVTIIQTKIFIEASINTKSIFRSLVLIASDIIVTMNTFIIFYAFFILLVVQFFVSPAERATVVLADIEATSEVDPAEDISLLREFDGHDFPKKIRFGGDIEGILFDNEDSSTAESLVVFYLSTFDLQKAETRAEFLANITNLNLSNVKISAVKDEGEIERYIDSLNSLGSFDRELTGIKYEKNNRFVELDFEIDGSVVRFGTLDFAYTGSYNLTDKLEDGFPNSLIGPLEMPLLSTVIEEAVVSPVIDDPLAVCFVNKQPSARFYLNSQRTEQLEKCEDFALVSLFWVYALDKDLALVGRDIEDYRVPFNTLLITSILPTGIFYLAILMLAVTTVCTSRILKGTNLAKKFFLRAPLAISGFIVGAVLSLIGLI